MAEFRLRDGAQASFRWMSRLKSNFRVEVGVASFERYARSAKPKKGSSAMEAVTASSTPVAIDIALDAVVSEAWDAVATSFERICPEAGISGLHSMTGEDAAKPARQRNWRNPDKPSNRRERQPAWSAFEVAGSRRGVQGFLNAEPPRDRGTCGTDCG